MGESPLFSCMELREEIRAGVAARVTEIAERVAASERIEVVEVEWKGSGRQRLLRIFIDKPAGVSHADCEFISKQVGTILDVEDVIPGSRYTLEVSTPGLDRPLRTRKDYERFVGRLARVKTREPLSDRSLFLGRLAGMNGENVLLDEDERWVIPLAAIESGRLEVEMFRSREGARLKKRRSRRKAKRRS